MDAYGFFIYWKSDGRVNMLMLIDFFRKNIFYCVCIPEEIKVNLFCRESRLFNLGLLLCTVEVFFKHCCI